MVSVQIAQGERDRLTAWLDRAIDTGRFEVPSGRHIVLNESAKFVRLARLQASAGTGAETLISFLTSLNPTVSALPARCCKELERALRSETSTVIGLRLCESDESAKAFGGRWHVFLPPLWELRRARAAARSVIASPTVGVPAPLPVPLAIAAPTGGVVGQDRAFV